MILNVRRITALVAAICLVANGAAPLFAAVNDKQRVFEHPPARDFAVLLDPDGNVESRFETDDFRLAKPVLQGMRLNRGDLQRWRERASALARLSKRGSAGVATILQIIDAMEAPTDAEQHARIRRLPVKVEKFPANDGRVGTYTNFVVGNTLRLQVFRSTPSRFEPLELHSQPMARSDDSDGPAAAHDSAHEESIEHGAEDSCYYEGQPAECATEQELDDAMILALATEDEAILLDSEMTYEYQALEAYCNANPWACPAISSGAFLNVDGVLPRGPFADGDGMAPPCWSEWVAFASSSGATWAAIFVLLAAITAGAAIPLALAVGLGLAVVAGMGSMVSTGSSMLECKVAIIQDPMRFDFAHNSY
jgi:hypothetical protein